MGLYDWLSTKRKAPAYTDKEIMEIYRSMDLARIQEMEGLLFRQAFIHLPHSRKAIDLAPEPDHRREAYTEAFIRFSTEMKKGRFQGRSSIKTYFTSIFNFTLIDLLRHKKTNTYKGPGAAELEKRLEVLSQKSRDILKDLLAREKADRAITLLRELKAGKTSCYDLIMLAAEGWKNAEIAERLGSTTGSVKTMKSDCRQQLLARL